ncbi:hypothetical protein [Acinetobacter beijerinckii]|uniref:hypothetical protein n=1 Tax=Acinetobacter beijerinckii TaxID=262668 RepID=UPI0040551EAA
MGIAIIIYNKQDDIKSFYLGSFSAFFSQINGSQLENMPVFRDFIDNSNNENDFFIENIDLIKFIDEITQLLESYDSIYLSENLRFSLQDFLLFVNGKILDEYKLLIS